VKGHCVKDMQQSQNFFLDTMSLHVAVNGMCSQQRPTWMRHKKASPNPKLFFFFPQHVVFEKCSKLHRIVFICDFISLHVAVNGMCSQQRPTWMRHKKNQDMRDKIANEHDTNIVANHNAGLFGVSQGY
jgi:competence transcription factor ComK